MKFLQTFITIIIMDIIFEFGYPFLLGLLFYINWQMEILYKKKKFNQNIDFFKNFN